MIAANIGLAIMVLRLFSRKCSATCCLLSGDFEDKRGQASPHNKTPEGHIERVKKHVNKFPRYKSHYTHHYFQKEYFHGVSGINDMYRLYVQDGELNGVAPVGNWVYHSIFNTQFNLSFHKPKTNTCKQCDIFKVNHSAAATDEEKDLKSL